MNFFKRVEGFLDDLDQQGARIIGSPSKDSAEASKGVDGAQPTEPTSTSLPPPQRESRSMRFSRAMAARPSSRPQPKRKSDDEIFAFLNEDATDPPPSSSGASTTSGGGGPTRLAPSRASSSTTTTSKKLGHVHGRMMRDPFDEEVVPQGQSPTDSKVVALGNRSSTTSIPDLFSDISSPIAAPPSSSNAPTRESTIDVPSFPAALRNGKHPSDVVEDQSDVSSSISRTTDSLIHGGGEEHEELPSSQSPEISHESQSDEKDGVVDTIDDKEEKDGEEDKIVDEEVEDEDDHWDDDGWDDSLLGMDDEAEHTHSSVAMGEEDTTHTSNDTKTMIDDESHTIASKDGNTPVIGMDASVLATSATHSASAFLHGLLDFTGGGENARVLDDGVDRSDVKMGKSKEDDGMSGKEEENDEKLNNDQVRGDIDEVMKGDQNGRGLEEVEQQQTHSSTAPSQATIPIEEMEEYKVLMASHKRMEKENILLKNEVRSLNDEVTSMEGRIKELQDVLVEMEEHTNLLEREMNVKDEEISKANGLLESQRLSEASKASEASKEIDRLTEQLEESQRHSSSQEQRLSAVQESMSLLSDKVETLEREKADLIAARTHIREEALARTHTQEEESARAAAAHEELVNSLQQRIAALESDVAHTSQALATAQRSVMAKEGAAKSATNEAREAREALESATKEQQEYKKRAKQVLQAKDETIRRLTDQLEGGTHSQESGGESEVVMKAKEDLRIAQEELRQALAELDDMQSALDETEEHMQHEVDVLREQAEVLQSTIESERSEKAGIQLELLRSRGEATQLRTEMAETAERHQLALKEKEEALSASQRRVKLLRAEQNGASSTRNGAREGEEGEASLSSSNSFSGDREGGEDAVRSLTDMLVQKQATIERLTNEKRALELRAESEAKRWRDEMQYRAASTPPTTGLSQRIGGMGGMRGGVGRGVRGEYGLPIVMDPLDDDDGMSAQDTPVKMRSIASLVPRSWGAPDRPETTRHRAFTQVLGGANALDSASARIVTFLRRYPIARLMVMAYVLVLHTWVMFLLSRPLEIDDETFAFPGMETPPNT